MTAVNAVWARQAFLPATATTAAGWQADVRLTIDRAGQITSVSLGVNAQPGDLRLEALLPGAPNLHSHSFQRTIVGAAERARPDGDDFWTWRTKMYDAALSLSPEAIEALAYETFVEMLEGGYTTVCEFHYLHNDPAGKAYAQPAELSLRIIAAAQRAGIRLCLLPVLYQHSGFGGLPPLPEQRRFVLSTPAYFDLVDALRCLAARSDFTVGLAPHSLRAVTLETLRELMNFRDSGMPLHLHIAEQVGELAQCQQFASTTPIHLLADQVPMDAGFCLVHATHPDVQELVKMAAAGVTVSLCPTTEGNLGDGIFPLPQALALGVKIGVGSDSQVSRRVWSELRQLEYSQRLLHRRRCIAPPPGISTGEALFGAVVSHKQAVTGGLASQLQVGASADFLGFDRDALNAARAALGPAAAAESVTEWLLDTLIFDESLPPVWDVYVQGRRRVERGRHIARDGVRTTMRV